MMKPAGEKKRNGNDKRPKTVPRLQRVIVAAVRRSVLTLSQSINSARRSFFLRAAAGAARRSAAQCGQTAADFSLIIELLSKHP